MSFTKTAPGSKVPGEVMGEIYTKILYQGFATASVLHSDQLGEALTSAGGSGLGAKRFQDLSGAPRAVVINQPLALPARPPYSKLTL